MTDANLHDTLVKFSYEDFNRRPRICVEVLPITDAAAFVAHIASTAKVVWIADAPWEHRGQMLRPLWMPHQWKPVDRTEVRKALVRTGAAFAQWTEGWDTAPTEWWYICCDDKDYDLGRLRKSTRRDVRLGLANCEVRPVDSNWFAHNGYGVYQAAFRRYGTVPLLSEAAFVEEFLKHARYPGRETWGAFARGRLVAWESCLVIGDTSVSSSSKSDPAFLKLRPNHALIYAITHHYIRERGSTYHSTGARVLMHRTNTQELDQRMGYRKVYCDLRVQLGWKGAFIHALRPGYWPRRLTPMRLDHAINGLKAFETMANIARRTSPTTRSE